MDLAAVELRTVEVTAAYNLFLAGLSGKYLGLRAPGIVVTPQLLEQFGGNAHALATTFLTIANRSLATQSAPVDAGSTGDAGNTPLEQVEATLRVAVWMNIKQATQWLKGGLPSVFTQPMGQGMGQLLQRQLANPQFKLPDALGRQWDAYTLIKTSVRDYFYQSAIDAAAAEIATKGGLGMVRYPSGHVHNGMIVSVSNEAGHGRYASLASVRAKVFHPNAQAMLEPYNHV